MKLNVSKIEDTGLRRAVIVGTFPFVLAANIVYWFVWGVIAVVTSPVAVFNSARRVW